MTDTNNPAEIAKWQSEQVRINDYHVAKMELARYKGICSRNERIAVVALTLEGATAEDYRQALAAIAYGR